MLQRDLLGSLQKLVEPVGAVWYSVWLGIVLFIPISLFFYNFVYGGCFGYGGICVLPANTELFTSYASVEFSPASFNQADTEYVVRAKQGYLFSLLFVAGIALATTVAVFLVFLVVAGEYKSQLVIEQGPLNWMVLLPLGLVVVLVFSTYNVPQSGCSVFRNCDGHSRYVAKILFFLALSNVFLVPPIFNSGLKFLCSQSLGHR